MTHAMTEPRITREEIEALLKLADAATPGPWSTDTIENQEGKGSFNSYAVGAGPSDKWKVVCDTLNSDLIEVEEEYDENGRSSWDEVGRRNAAFIAAANPATLKALCTLALQALDMEPRQDGNRPLPFDRNQLGRFVREAWVRWAQTQPNPKPSWLVPYDELSEPDKEADRQIGETVARWTLIGDAAAITSLPEPRR